MAQEITVTKSGSALNASTGSSTTVPKTGGGTETVQNVIYQTEGGQMTLVFELSGATFPTDISNVFTWTGGNTPTFQSGSPRRVSDTEIEIVLASYTNTTAVQEYSFTLTVGGATSNLVTLYQGYRMTSTIATTVSGSGGSYTVANSPDSIDVPQGAALTLTMNLTNGTTDGSEVQFPAPPPSTYNASTAFAWQSTAPSATYSPSPMTTGAQSVTMTETNMNPGTGSQSLHFKVNVQVKPSGGSWDLIESTDPTLVNKGSDTGG